MYAIYNTNRGREGNSSRDEKCNKKQNTFAKNRMSFAFSSRNESNFSLTPCVPYAWQAKGENVEIPTARSKSIHVAGFYTKSNIIIDYQSDKTMNAQRLVEIFNDFVSKTSKKTVVILDNSPVHTSHLFTSFISKWEEEHDVYLFFLPKYSPE